MENASMTVEKDPTGRDAHSPGAKLDQGKVRPGLVLGGFARALGEVSKVGTFGAAKYSENGWVDVPNGQARYSDAGLRHWLAYQSGEQNDPDSKLSHLAHAAWNALAVLDLELRKEKPTEYKAIVRAMPPPPMCPTEVVPSTLAKDIAQTLPLLYPTGGVPRW